MSRQRINTNPHIDHFILKRNKNFPNSALPVLIYKSALQLPRQKNKAAEIARQIFLRNDWGNTWRNGIYDFHHYHSNTHEALAISSGNVRVMLGGPNGKAVELEAGDVIIIPAGVGHKCLSAGADFECVGAYPQAKDYDINHGTAAELEKAIPNIKAVPLPSADPVFGKEGFIDAWWK